MFKSNLSPNPNICLECFSRTKNQDQDQYICYRSSPSWATWGGGHKSSLNPQRFHYQPRSLTITPHFCVTEEMPRSQQPLQLLCLYEVSLSTHRNSEIWEKLLLFPLQRCLTCVLYQVLASPISAFTCKCSIYTLIPWKCLFLLSLLISVMVRELEVWETKQK